MSKLDEKLLQDRALREAAKAVVEADLALLREDWAPGAVSRRLSAQAEAAGRDMAADAVAWGKDNKGLIAAVGGAIASAAVFWVARAPILRGLGLRDRAAEPGGQEDT